MMYVRYGSIALLAASIAVVAGYGCTESRSVSTPTLSSVGSGAEQADPEVQSHHVIASRGTVQAKDDDGGMIASHALQEDEDAGTPRALRHDDAGTPPQALQRDEDAGTEK